MITIKIEKKGKSDLEELMDRLKARREKMLEMGEREGMPPEFYHDFYTLMIDEINRVLEEMMNARWLARRRKRERFPHNLTIWIQRRARKMSVRRHT